MDWTTATEEHIRQIGADTSLVKLLSKILRCLSPEVFICSTIRNQETYGGFKQRLEKAGIGHHVMTGPVSHVFPYNRVSAIEMIKLDSPTLVSHQGAESSGRTFWSQLSSQRCPLLER
ncbi:hypothetical protein FQN60_004253, partial [Etheostoma spectabile]